MKRNIFRNYTLHFAKRKQNCTEKRIQHKETKINRSFKANVGTTLPPLHFQLFHDFIPSLSLPPPLSNLFIPPSIPFNPQQTQTRVYTKPRRKSSKQRRIRIRVYKRTQYHSKVTNCSNWFLTNFIANFLSSNVSQLPETKLLSKKPLLCTNDTLFPNSIPPPIPPRKYIYIYCEILFYNITSLLRDRKLIKKKKKKERNVENFEERKWV